jgi:hypothetical protein
MATFGHHIDHCARRAATPGGGPESYVPFDRFEKLFLHEVVLSQAIWWSKIAVIFSPASIAVFGLPEHDV